MRLSFSKSLKASIKSSKYSTKNLPKRQVMEFDVVIVGAGPAGLSAAIRLKQLDSSLSVVILEKASQLGGHTLSGAVFEPRALNELLPNWSELNSTEFGTKVTQDKMFLLTKSRAIPLPIPSSLRNSSLNYIISLSEVVRWLGGKAEEVGVEIYPGFAGAELVYDENDKDNKIVGIATNDVGLDRNGQPKDNYERGLELRAKRAVLLAEGCHGSLSKIVLDKFKLRAGRSHQTYGLGLKEVWQVPKNCEHFVSGKVTHSLGWPLDNETYGGSFMYHYGNDLVSVGLVIGLDYSNPHLNPYKEFQKMKLNPFYKRVLEKGKCISYGARALNEGGWQSIPKLDFPGGALIGCSAGFLNVPKIKGTHTAMKSGMIAAESLISDSFSLVNYERNLKDSWVGEELYKVRNVRPAFNRFGGLFPGILFAGIDSLIFGGKLPFTLSHGSKMDHEHLKPIGTLDHGVPEYQKPDGKLTFELLESVSRTGTNHEEDQPCHLKLKQPAAAHQISKNLPIYGGPEQKFCPAGVYEYVKEVDGGTRFQINAQNCIHCKTCDIKDPSQNINWTVPEGGGGPQYTNT